MIRTLETRDKRQETKDKRRDIILRTVTMTVTDYPTKLSRQSDTAHIQNRPLTRRRVVGTDSPRPLASVAARSLHQSEYGDGE